MTDEKPQINQDTEQQKPDREITARLAGMSSVEAVVADLSELGMPIQLVRVLHGPDGVKAFDLNGDDHGWWAQLVRTVKTAGGADGNLLQAYNEGLLAGNALIRFPVLADRSRDDLVDVLRKHGATGIAHFSAGGMESIPSRA